MTTLLITFGAFLIVILLMAIGVILNKKTISGSCGGLSSVGVDRVCNCEDVCEEHQPQLYQITEPGEAQSKSNE